MKGVPVFALVVFLFTDFGLNSVMGQAKEPAPVFRPALEQIQTRIPVLLPSKLPSHIRERDIKLASGTVSEDGYFISLYFTETGSDASFVAGFGGSVRVFRDLPNTRPVAMAGGRTGMFRPVSCGGSCAPANLWWEQNGVMYQIQMKLRSTAKETDQRRILVETADSTARSARMTGSIHLHLTTFAAGPNVVRSAG